MAFTIRSGGVWLHGISSVGDIKYSWGENGPLEASWGMVLPAGFLHPALTQGKTVEIFYCGVRVWRGVLEEPDRDNWTCTAIGFCEHFRNVANLSVDLDGNPELGDQDIYFGALYAAGLPGAPTWPDGLIRGFDFTIDATLPGAPDTGAEGFPDEIFKPDNFFTLREILDAFTDVTGKRWVVDENGLLTIPPTPTGPTVALTPDVPGVGLTLENYYSTTYLKFLQAIVDDGSGGELAVYDTVWAASPDAWRWGPRERTLFLGNENPMETAQDIVDVLQAESLAAPTQGVELVDGQLTNMGGTRIPLPLLKSNVIVRHFGVADVPGARDVHEWYINHVEMDTTTGRATITPRYVAARTLAQVFASFIVPAKPVFAYDSAAA